MSLELMKMVVLGSVKVERILMRMGSDAAGLEWEVNLEMLHRSGKKRCATVNWLHFYYFYFNHVILMFLIKCVHEK